MASLLSAPVRSAGSTMRGINGLGGKPKRARNLPEAELGRLSRLASRMTVLWAATVLEHFLRPGSQFRQGRRALAHGQLRSEHVDEIEQGQQGSSRAEAVFCHFPSPVGSHSCRRCRRICHSRCPPRRRLPGVPASRRRPGGRGGDGASSASCDDADIAVAVARGGTGVAASSRTVVPPCRRGSSTVDVVVFWGGLLMVIVALVLSCCRG